MYSIMKEFSFSAAHYLQGLPPTHPCSQLHGHNYRVKIEIDTTDVDKIGFVLDYRKLDGLKQGIDEMLDHTCLNDVLEFNPTAENIARWLWDRVHSSIDHELRAIHESYGLVLHISETEKTWASYDGAT